MSREFELMIKVMIINSSSGKRKLDARLKSVYPYEAATSLSIATWENKPNIM